MTDEEFEAWEAESAPEYERQLRLGLVIRLCDEAIEARADLHIALERLTRARDEAEKAHQRCLRAVERAEEGARLVGRQP